MMSKRFLFSSYCFYVVLLIFAAGAVNANGNKHLEKQSDVLSQFPGAIKLSTFIAQVISEYGLKGYVPAQSVPAMATCRDDTTGEIRSVFDQAGFHSAFSLQTLSALPVTGNTALGAWYHHLMDKESPGVIVYLPHVGLSGSSKLGYLTRYGIKESAKSCGANHALLGLWSKGEFGPYPGDFELSEISSWLKDFIPEILKDPNPILKIAQVERDLGYSSLKERLIKMQQTELHYHPILLVTGIFIETDREDNWRIKRSTDDWIQIQHFEWLEAKPVRITEH